MFPSKHCRPRDRDSLNFSSANDASLRSEGASFRLSQNFVNYVGSMIAVCFPDHNCDLSPINCRNSEEPRDNGRGVSQIQSALAGTSPSYLALWIVHRAIPVDFCLYVSFS